MNGRESCKVLVADGDPLLCSNLKHFFLQEGVVAEVATDGRKAFDLFGRLHPDIVLADMHLPALNGFELLATIRKNGSSVPVILTAAIPDIGSAMKALQDGAYDCLVKPLQLPIVLQKVYNAIENTRLLRENIALNEIVQLYNVTGKLAATHNMDALLDIVFRYGLELTGAQCGAIFLRDEKSDELVYARQRWPLAAQQRSPDDEAARCEAARWTLTHERPLVIEGGKARPEAIIHPACGRIHSLLAVPLRVSRATMGVFLVERTAASASPFSTLDYYRMEILASQAGIAIDNAIHCDSLKRKLDEAKQVGVLTERLLSCADPDDVIRSLFEKARECCPVDIMGFLLVSRSRHEFLYWTRGAIDDTDLRTIYRGCSNRCKHGSATGAVSVKQLIGRKKSSGPLRLPLQFQHFTPIVWNGRNLGIFFAGAERKLLDTKESEELLSSLVAQTRIALINSKLHSASKENYLKSIKALAAAADAKDKYTKGHSEKVMALAKELAHEIRDFNEGRVAALCEAALLHDIGKIGIPGAILSKPGRLTSEEFNGVMKHHCKLGANFVRGVPFLKESYSMILHHHEHFDGSGYPVGLKGDAIPIGARVLHIADAFDAMTSDRPYRTSLGNAEAVRRIIAGSGKHFDPDIVGHFLRIVKRKGIIV